MNILMIFRNNPLETSGAVTLDLFNDFRKKGHTVKLLVNKYDPAYPDGIVSMETPMLFWKNRIINKLHRTFKTKKERPTDNKYHFHEADETKMFYSTRMLLKKAGFKPDVIVVLFAKNFVNSRNIYELNQRTKAPVYWMMYDTSPLTGGCHYSWECPGYQRSCGNCPGLFSSDPHDLTYHNLAYKKKYLDKTDVSIVLASAWQHHQAINSTLFKNRAIHKILIAINPEIFRPLPKTVSRKQIPIPHEKKVVFFGAYFLNHERKGVRYLLEALDILNVLVKDYAALKSNILLLIAGQEADKIKDKLPFEYLSLGMLDNTYGVASAYQAADIFVCPSIEDAGPSMVNQSIMCGTPVVAFAQGVALDIVITGKTGYRAAMRNSADLAKGIYDILMLDEVGHTQMKNNCREMGMTLFHPDDTADKWLSVFGKHQNNI